MFLHFYDQKSVPISKHVNLSTLQPQLLMKGKSIRTATIFLPKHSAKLVLLFSLLELWTQNFEQVTRDTVSVLFLLLKFVFENFLFNRFGKILQLQPQKQTRKHKFHMDNLCYAGIWWLLAIKSGCGGGELWGSSVGFFKSLTPRHLDAGQIGLSSFA